MRENLVKIKCTCCGRLLSEDRYYLTESLLYKANGRVPFCKDCVRDCWDRIFARTNNYKVSMYRLCRKLDIAFRHVIYDMALGESERRKSALFAMYFQKLNSLGKKNDYGGDFDASDNLERAMERDLGDVENIEKDMLEGFELTKDIILFWGTGFVASEYYFLEEQYNSYIASREIDIDSKPMEELLKQICFQHLTINTRRKSGESVDKDLKTLQDLMTSCNFKPVQETGMNANDQVTFGTLIKKWENEHPIPEPDPAWKDVNNVAKQMRVWFTGHLSRMMGVESGVTEEYQEELEKYTVEDGDP